MAPITVAIAGATGLLGKTVVRTFLGGSYHPQAVGRVIALSRDANSASAKELKALGAEVVEGVVSASTLGGVDVFVNSIPHGATLDEFNVYTQAAIDAGVKVYFTSNYGFDYDRTDVKNPVYDFKKGQEEYARKISGGKTKVIVVSNGAFLDTLWEFGPYLGIDWKNRKFEVPGDVDAKNAYTHTQDIASTIVRLSILASENPAAVPDRVHIQGDQKSAREIADTITKLTGDKVEVTAINAAEYKATLAIENFPGHLRLILGQGANYEDNDNELVNPGESLWKWTTFESFAEASKGSLWE